MRFPPLLTQISWLTDIIESSLKLWHQKTRLRSKDQIPPSEFSCCQSFRLCLTCIASVARFRKPISKLERQRRKKLLYHLMMRCLSSWSAFSPFTHANVMADECRRIISEIVALKNKAKVEGPDSSG